MKLILTSLALLMTLSSCCHDNYYSQAPGGRRGGYVPTPPPKFSGAGTNQPTLYFDPPNPQPYNRYFVY